MSLYLGDFLPSQTVHFLWGTNGANGASITRATNGTVSVYKDNGTGQTTTGVTDTEDFDTLTGVHACAIATTDSFYVARSNYSVVLSAATIDGQTVNSVLANFSIMNRADSYEQTWGQVDNTAFTATATVFESDTITEATADHFIGRSVYPYSGSLLGQCVGVITDYALTGGRGRFTVSGSPSAEAMGDNTYFVIA